MYMYKNIIIKYRYHIPRLMICWMITWFMHIY